MVQGLKDSLHRLCVKSCISFFFSFFLWEHLLCAAIQVSPKRFTLENLIIIALFSVSQLTHRTLVVCDSE